MKVSEQYIVQKYGKEYTYKNFEKEFKKSKINIDSEEYYGVAVTPKNKEIKLNEAYIIGFNSETNLLGVGIDQMEELDEGFLQQDFETSTDYLNYITNKDVSYGRVNKIEYINVNEFLNNVNKSNDEHNIDILQDIFHLTYNEDLYKESIAGYEDIPNDLYLAKLIGSEKYFGKSLRVIGFEPEMGEFLGVSEDVVNNDYSKSTNINLYMIPNELLGNIAFERKDGDYLGYLFK